MKKSKKPTSTPQPKMGEVIQPRMQGQGRFDGWQNLVTLLGTSADKRTQSTLSWDLRPPEFYEQLYAGGGIPARIVDLIPDESLRRWVDWLNVSKDEAEEIEERCEELDLRGAFLRAWKWGRAYGGGLLHIVTDTSDPSGPIQKGEKVIGLRDLSRWDVRILTTDVEYDFGSPNFGHPRIYYLNVQMGAQYKGYPIHWTRMIRFDGQLVPRRTFIRNNYWHDSILNRIYNSIRNYETSNDSAATCLQDFSVDVYKLNNVAAMIGAGKEQLVKNRIEMMAYTKSVINAMILDTKDEEYESKGRSLEGVAELLVHQANRLVAETDIPHTKLLGESPDGSNATGNSTTQQWYNFIDSERENYAKPKLKRLIGIIFPEKQKLGFKFKPLRVLDDVETADLRLKVAQTDDIYLTQQVLDPSEVTESRFGSEEYSMQTKIDKEARESGLIAAHDPGGMGENEEGDGGPDGSGPGGKTPGSMGQEGPGNRAGGPFQTTGDQPPEGSKEEEAEPSDETEKGNKPAKAKKGADLTGKGKESLDSDDTKSKHATQGVTQEPSETSFEAGIGESSFALRNNVLEVPGGKPATQSFISQTESLPFRDPKSDKPMKGPGIPNQARSYLPTRGNGVTAASGFDFEKDAGQKGSSQEITQIEPRRTEDSFFKRTDAGDFKENDHPRANDGKFGSGGGSASKSPKQGAGKESDKSGKDKSSSAKPNEDQARSIRYYTGSMSGVLKECDKKPAADPDTKKINDTINEYLDKAPKYEGTIQRGLVIEKGGLDSLLEKYKQGSIITVDSKESWTKDAEANKNHLISVEKNTRDPIKVTFEYPDSSAGVDISENSRFPEEQEVVIPKGSKYKVKEVKKEGDSVKIVFEGAGGSRSDSAELRNRAATIIVKRDGKFLMGRRRDNEKWSLPGGHVEDMESHHQGAVRELMEETGIESKRLRFEGGRMVEPSQGKSVHVNIYSHNAKDTDKPTWKIDPDKEFKEFKWFSQKDPLPEEVTGNLQHPNNIALIHLGLLK